MIDGEDFMNFDELRKSCESEIERHLLGALYPELGPDAQKEIEAQHMIDYYDMPVTLPDFAFPDLQIAIYCDGYEFHSERNPFQKDRQQSRDLQLQGWCVLRFAGREILNEPDAVVGTIQSKRYFGKRGNGRINRNSYGHGGTYFPLEERSQRVWSRRSC